MHYFIQVMFISLLATLSITALGQHPEEHVKEFEAPSQMELKSWRSAYSAAVAAQDTAALYDAAFQMMRYHSQKGNYDSTYYYNETIIATALVVDETKQFIDAHKDNNFMDIQMYLNEEKARERRSTLFPYLTKNNSSLASKYDIAIIFASYFHQIGNLDSTIYYQQKALHYSDEIGEQHANKVSATIALAMYLQLAGRPAEAIQYLTTIEEQLEAKYHSPLIKLRFYLILSKTLFGIEEVDNAQFYLAKAKTLVDQNKYTSFDHELYKLQGRISSSQGEVKEAIVHFEQALTDLKKNDLKVFKSALWSHLAKQYYLLDDLSSMNSYMDSLRVNYDKLLDRNKMDYHFHNLKYQLRLGKFESAKNSLDIINAYNSKPTPERLTIAQLNYLYFQKTGNLPQEHKAFKRYTFLKDSLRDIANIALARRTEALFNREKQDLKIEGLTQTTAAQDQALAIRNNALIMGGIMLLILAGLFYVLLNLYRKNQAQTVKISKALADNQMLIKEIHHRVKNNLQVVSSLLSMQERKVDDETTKEALKSSKARVQTMSLIHKSLYQKDDVRSVNIKSYFHQLTENLVASYAIHPIELKLDIDELQIDVDSLAPLGLVANELICNALKHGIPDKEDGVLSVSIKEKGEHIILTVEDNGGNFKGDKLVRKDGSLGTRLIEAFSRNLSGEIKVVSGETTKISLIVNKNKLH